MPSSISILPLQVNKDFGSIFSTLLPGATAKLAPPQGCGVLDGLEFKVALGDTWKENLTELSGGQRFETLYCSCSVFSQPVWECDFNLSLLIRSLVALSLILAMLLFKPAPIYILDEVDAALDLSHTQNIGQMLRTHFTHSQVSDSKKPFVERTTYIQSSNKTKTVQRCIHFAFKIKSTRL